MAGATICHNLKAKKRTIGPQMNKWTPAQNSLKKVLKILAEENTINLENITRKLRDHYEVS